MVTECISEIPNEAIIAHQTEKQSEKNMKKNHGAKLNMANIDNNGSMNPKGINEKLMRPIISLTFPL